MEVPITQFRREIFALTSRALEGEEVWVTHRGRRLRIVPDGQLATRMSRIVPMQVLIGGSGEDAALLDEMRRSWEADWERDFGPAPSTDALSGKPGAGS